jgi:hypothetical protein
VIHTRAKYMRSGRYSAAEERWTGEEAEHG